LFSISSYFYKSKHSVGSQVGNHRINPHKKTAVSWRNSRFG
jgi:hypothetical protein